MSIHVSEQAADKVKVSKTRSALLYASILNLVILVAALSNAEDSPDTALFLMMTFVFVGLYVFVATVETTLLHHLIGLKTSLTAWVLILAYITYVAKAQALSEINEIFHIDASLLPMTIIATTAFKIVKILLWPVLGLAILTMAVAYLWRNDFVGSHDGIAILVSLLVGAGAQLFFATLVWGWVGASEQKKATIYRVAHFSDFSASFRCSGIDENKFSVLFVNPEKTRVIVAPKISDFYIGPARAQWLQPVPIPEEFPLLPCTPVNDWR